MKQTAVMSLLKEIYGENWSTNVVFQDFANKYLEMEKEQIIKAHSAGQESAYGFKDKETAGEYYQKTYEK
jgi:hypothetical protein